MNVPQTLHAETVELVTTQMAHTVAFAQVDGQAQTAPQVRIYPLLRLNTRKQL